MTEQDNANDKGDFGNPLLGDVAAIAERFSGLDNDRKPKLEYIVKIQEMNDEKLFEEMKHKIWLSAYAGNNPRSDYHWHVDALYGEGKRRYGNDDVYKRAWEYVAKD
jgi:hypothetical protein